MKINNKIYRYWTKDDFYTILNNEDVKEFQTLDFKRTFEFLEVSGEIEELLKRRKTYKRQRCWRLLNQVEEAMKR